MKENDAKKVCEILGISLATLRKGLKDKVFPFGGCVGNATYVLYPGMVKRYLGYDMDILKEMEEENEKILMRKPAGKSGSVTTCQRSYPEKPILKRSTS